ncbi:MAG: HD domain-containing protein [Planctomycetes bacterium]|nr:HD domain-containing protein [Planctomycetota bacterium]
MKGVLIIQEGVGRGRKFLLPPSRSSSIGRGPDNEIQIYGEEVSRLHCTIVGQNGQFAVTDKSRNGTFINGQRVREYQLADGDVLRVGNVTFKFSVESTGEDTPGGRKTDVRFVPHLTRGRGTHVVDQAAAERTILMDSTAALKDVQDYHRIHQTLTTIYKVGNLIHSIENPQELLNTLMDTIIEVVKPQRAFLLLKDLETGEIRSAVTRTFNNSNHEESLAISQTIVQDCVTKGDRVLCPDAMLDERFSSGQSILLNQIRSVMCVPLETQKQILGAIYVDSSQEAGAFSESDLELLSAIGQQAGISIERANLVKELEDLAIWSILTLVAAIEAKDEYTRGHSERVSAYSVQIAEELGLGDRLIESIRLGALLHDVGKIGVPDSVLRKPGPLTKEEFELIKEHPGRGAHIISQIQHPRMNHSVDIARHHHERWDGKGYPDGLSEKGIPFTARIVCVADSYDAMSSARPYRQPYSREFIEEQFKLGMSTQFDPQVADAFMKIWTESRLRQPKTLQLELMEAHRSGKGNVV